MIMPRDYKCNFGRLSTGRKVKKAEFYSFAVNDIHKGMGTRMISCGNIYLPLRRRSTESRNRKCIFLCFRVSVANLVLPKANQDFQRKYFLPAETADYAEFPLRHLRNLREMFFCRRRSPGLLWYSGFINYKNGTIGQIRQCLPKVMVKEIPEKVDIAAGQVSRLGLAARRSYKAYIIEIIRVKLSVIIITIKTMVAHNYYDGGWVGVNNICNQQADHRIPIF